MAEHAGSLSAVVTVSEQRLTDDLDRLLSLLPAHLQQALASSEAQHELLEVVLDLGRPPEAPSRPQCGPCRSRGQR